MTKASQKIKKKEKKRKRMAVERFKARETVTNINVNQMADKKIKVLPQVQGTLECHRRFSW